MKDADIGKGLQSFEKVDRASAAPPALPDLQDATAQAETEITVEAATGGGGKAVGLMRGYSNIRVGTIRLIYAGIGHGYAGGI
jgi:hypothetical protein